MRRRARRRSVGRGRSSPMALSLAAQPSLHPAGRPGSGLVAGRQAPRHLLLRPHLDLRSRTAAADAHCVPTATATERDPAWSPDGRRIVFAADERRRLRPVRRRRRRQGRPPAHRRGRRRAVAVVDARRPDRLQPPRDAVRTAGASSSSATRAATPTPLFPDALRRQRARGHASRRTASASPTSPTATATTATSICGSRICRRCRARPRAADAADASPRREGLSVVGARQFAHRLLRAARRPRVGLGRRRLKQYRVQVRAQRRRAGRPTPVLVSRRGGAPAWSPDGRTHRDRRTAAGRSGLQRQSAAATTTTRRRCSRRRASRCGSSTRRSPVDAGARQLTPPTLSAAQSDRRVRPRVGDAQASLLLERSVGRRNGRG